MTEVLYLGHIVDQEGIKISPDRMRAIREYPIPRCVRDVRAFLGMVNYHRQFFDNWSNIIVPLTKMTKKCVNFKEEFGPEQIDCVNKIKELVSTLPTLIHFDPSLPIRVKTDSNGYGMGAKLEHLINGKWLPVLHISKKMTEREQNYGISEKECLAIVFATN